MVGADNNNNEGKEGRKTKLQLEIGTMVCLLRFNGFHVLVVISKNGKQKSKF